MSTMVMVSRSGTRSFGPADQQQEVMGLVLPDKTKNNVAMTTTQMEMPNSVQTTDKPVVVMIAPRQMILSDRTQAPNNDSGSESTEAVRKELENLGTKQ